MASENEQEKRKESIESILAEWRDALRKENPWGENDTRTAWINSGSILSYLDRIEAAWNRERDRLMTEPRSWEECVERFKKAREIHDDLY